MKYLIILFLTSCSLFIPPDDITFRGKVAEQFVEEMQKER